MPYAEDKRRHLLLVCIGLCALLIGWRLIDLSILNNEKYAQKGVNQRVVQKELRGERGSILDRNGFELAVSFPQPFIFIDPVATDNGVEKSQILANVIDLKGVDEHEEAKTILTKFNSPTSFEYLLREADLKTAESVIELGLTGVYVGYEPRRFHPFGDQLARGVLGSVTVDNVGISGLEFQYEERLKGTPGMQVAELSADGSTIPTKTRVLQPASQGADLILTVDKDLQSQVEFELRKAIKEAEAKSGIVIIQEPSTGEILAMASMAVTETGEVVSTRDNKAALLSYEPASVMKAITFAAVVNEGLGDRNSQKDVPDTVTEEWEDYEGETVTERWRDSFEYGTREMSIKEILTESSNTGTIVWGKELGKENLHKYLTDFGFGTVTDLSFTGEPSGSLKPLSQMTAIDLNTISIGHGISASPIQLVTAYSAIANDGVYVAPRILKHIVDASGGKEYISGTPSRRVISSTAAREVASLLSSVVDDGTAEKAKVSGYKIAGKTGTSWKYHQPENSCDLGGEQFDPYRDADCLRHYTATMIGFFPALRPEFAMLVIIDDPPPVEEKYYASHVAAPIFGELASWTLRHYQVSPVSELLLAESDDQEFTLGEDVSQVENSEASQ